MLTGKLVWQIVCSKLDCKYRCLKQTSLHYHTWWRLLKSTVNNHNTDTILERKTRIKLHKNTIADALNQRPRWSHFLIRRSCDPGSSWRPSLLSQIWLAETRLEKIFLAYVAGSAGPLKVGRIMETKGTQQRDCPFLVPHRSDEICYPVVTN